MTATSSGSSSRAPSSTRSLPASSVLLDTNALFLPVHSRFPLEAEVDRLCPGAKLAVPSSALEELERLVARGVPGAPAAWRFALRYPVVPVEGRGDAALLRSAIRHRVSVVTADRALAARLQRAGLSVLVPRDRHRLELRPARPPSVRAPRVLAARRPVGRRQRL
ncbi:MAG TPA: hypothetical protein VEG66_07185 [Thermoplasmata archaeon]|jgi:rRNA-processing protein FCF1|nr:hypothetical protein [Thermoplasmata archaeon]